jgi:hypothetical protein
MKRRSLLVFAIVKSGRNMSLPVEHATKYGAFDARAIGRTGASSLARSDPGLLVRSSPGRQVRSPV